MSDDFDLSRINPSDVFYNVLFYLFFVSDNFNDIVGAIGNHNHVEKGGYESPEEKLVLLAFRSGVYVVLDLFSFQFVSDRSEIV